jgi:hypothetical protein
MCRGKKQQFSMSGMDRAGVSEKSSHVLKNIIFEKIPIILETRLKCLISHNPRGYSDSAAHT